MAFKDLVRQQRQQGSGILSSVGSAAAGSARESLDIRNALFSSGSFLNTLFPKVKGFKAGNNVGKGKSPSLLSSSGSDLSSSKLDQIGENTKIAAKNSFVLPAMARDMNVMRQNIIKLVKMSGGKPSTKSDMFFLKSAERESAYESAMAKSKGSMTTRVGSGTQSKTGETGSSMVSILSSILLGGFKTIKGMLSGLLSTFDIFKGIMGSIASSAIFKLFTGGIGTLLKSVFAAIGSPLVLGIIAGFLPLLYTMFKAKQILDAPADKDELRETQLQSNKNTINESKNIKIGDKTANDLIREEQNLYELAAKNPRMMTDSKKKESAARRKALESAGIFPLEIDDPSRPKKKQLVFRREVKEENLLDLPPDTSTPTPSSSNKPTPQQIERAVAAPGSTSPTPTSSASNLDGDLVSFIKSKEGLRLKAYEDHGQYSIGYGTKASGPDEVITEAEAERRLLAEIKKRKDYVVDFGKKHNYDWNEKQINALTSFAYNVGSLDQLTANGKRSNEEIARMMPQYNKASGKVLPALAQRRNEEVAMFGGASTAPTVLASATPTTPTSTNTVGSSLNAGSVQVADGRMSMGSGQSVVVNAPQTNVQAPQGGQRSSGNVPSVVDTDFMRHLVAQLVT